MRKLALACSIVTLLAFGCAQDDPALEGEPEETTEVEESEAPEESGAASGDHGTETFTDMSFSTDMELDDFYFEPTTIKAPGGAKAALTLTNEGDATHTFTIDDLEVDEELDPGASKEIVVELGTETRYEYYCRFHADSQNMRGSFSPH